MPEAVERCVEKLMADPDFEPQGDKTKKESAWAVCQAQHKAKGGIILEMITEPLNVVVAQEEDGEVLRFTNAILVVAETNRNRDTITEEGISEICASLPGRPIDWDHEFTKNVGVFTGARAVKLEETWAASVDGIIWADRFPEAADGVRKGTLHLSIEARADTAQCSICDGVFGEVVEYCQHLLNKIQSGANRILKGLKAVGGALTPKPAGTGTTFDQSKVYFVANHQEEEVIDILDEAQYDEIMGKELTTKTRKALKSSSFALIQKKDGKTIRRFPIHDCAHARNALARLSGAKNLSSEERAMVKRKAQAKLNSKECKAERKSDTKGGHSMTEQTLEEVQAQLDQMVEKLDQEVAAREQAQADLATAQEEVATLQAKVEELTSEVGKVNTSLKEAVTAHRVEVLTLTGMDKDEVEEATETISKMDDAAFNLFLAHVRKPATKQQKGSGGLTHDGDDKPKLVLGGVS